MDNIYPKYEELLKQNGVSSYEVSKQTGIDVSTMSNWKHGQYTPKIDKVQKIAEYFDVPLSYFYD